MWMMGYNDVAGEFESIQDSFNARRLRPLMPRPPAAGAPPPAACFSRIHGSDLLAINHHLAMAEQNKRELNTQQVVVSSRWNPTPEQLQTLEELYRGGTRTPSAEQIQHITAQLRRYGKIEGKNVFYWFQNHKARERQKRRRQLEPSNVDDQSLMDTNPQNGEKKDSPTDVIAGANRTGLYEVEQTKHWASYTNSCTIIAPEKTVSTQGAAISEDAAAELIKADGWVQFEDEAELQLQGRNATWQMMNLSYSCSSSTNLIITSSSPSTLTSTTVPSTAHLMIKPQHHEFNIHTNFIQPNYINSTINAQNLGDNAQDRAQILQLFPLESDRRLKEDFDYDPKEDEEESRVCETTNANTPYQFFEFLPLKN